MARRIALALAAAGIGLCLAALPSSPARADSGKELYLKDCAGCHGDTGMADTKKGKTVKAKQFKGDEHLQGPDVVEFVTKSIREKKKHKTVAKKVTDEQLKEIAPFIQSLANGG